MTRSSSAARTWTRALAALLPGHARRAAERLLGPAGGARQHHRRRSPDYSFNPYDKFLVVLDNGQIWQQLESDSGIKAPFHKGEKNTVTISRGFIGSYNCW